MPEPDVTSHLLKFANSWAVDMRDVEPGSAEFTELVRQLAQEIRAEGERASARADRRFFVLYQNCPVAALLVDDAGVIVAANPAFLRLVEAPSADGLLGARLVSIGAGESDRETLRDVLVDVLAAPECRSCGTVDVGVAVEGGKVVALSASTLPSDDVAHSILMFEDRYAFRQLEEAVRYQGLHDQLTGLPNASYLRGTLNTLTAGALHERVGLLLVDIDGFSVINEGVGPDTADRVLRGIAPVIRAVFADHDAFIARMYGDVFAIALRGELTPTAVVRLTEQMMEELAKPVYVDEGVGVGVSVSVGIAIAVLPGAEPADLIRSAGTALRQAKELGKAQWVLFDPHSGAKARNRSQLASAIAGALSSGEMTTVYRPHVVLPDAEIVTSLSATLLWRHPTLGEFRAEHLYPLAEMTGMIVPLGRYLLAEVLRTTAIWQARFGLAAPMVCLTLPRRLAVDGDLVSIVRAALGRYELRPRDLMLCTDGPSLLDTRGDVVASIGDLAALGVLFVLNIDGLQDLELVASLKVPVPAVMLSGALAEALDVDDPPEPVRRNLRQLVERARELGVRVGTYGVRSELHARLLYELGVVVGAGPYLVEHLTREEAEVWVGRTYPMR